VTNPSAPGVASKKRIQSSRRVIVIVRQRRGRPSCQRARTDVQVNEISVLQYEGELSVAGNIINRGELLTSRNALQTRRRSAGLRNGIRLVGEVWVERDIAAGGEEEDVTVDVVGQTGHEGEAEQMAVRGKPSRCLVASL
jgi:hypothetical protein